MPNEKEKDELLTTPLEDAPRTTPYRTPPPSGETPPDLPDGSLSALRQRYDILAELGRGGMGIVYRARDRETGDVVALKVLRPEIAARPEVIERFKSELLLARKITHKNVCRTYELLRFGDTVAIAMEYVEGESLRSLLKRVEGFSVRQGLKMLRQMITGLAEAHAQGVVHRDLKPENIVITRDGNVKVMDFGIARSIEAEATQTSSIVGTPAYMSPEQAEGKPVDARTDIYALGLIVYEMLTGRPPFHADTPVGLVHKQIHETPPPARSVDPYLPVFLERAIEKCLEKNPKKRFQSVAELDAALTETPEVNTPTTEGADISLPPHLAYWQRSDWALLGGAIVAVVLFFVLFYSFHPAPVLEVKVNEAQQKQIMAEMLKKLNMDWEPQGATLSFGYYTYYGLASKVGIRQVHQVFKDYQQSYGWWGSLVSSQSPGRDHNGFYFFNGGGQPAVLALPLFEVNLPAKPPPNAAALAEMKDVARRGVATFSGIDVSTKEPDEVYLPSGGHTEASFTWRLTKKSAGLVEYLGTSVDGSRIRTLRRWSRFPNFEMSLPFEPAPPWQYAFAPIVMIIFSLTLFLWQKLYKQGRSFQNLTLALLVGLCLALGTLTEEFTAHNETFLKIILPAASFCLGTLVSYATLNVVLYYLRRRLPIQVSNYLSLWRHGIPVRSAGLELLRGILAGLIFSCAWMVLMSLAGIWGKAFVGMISLPAVPFYELIHDLTSMSANIVDWLAGNYNDFAMSGGLIRFYVLFILAEALLVAWLLVALPLSLLAKVSARVPVLIAALAGLWLGLGFSLAGAMAFPSVPYYIVVALQAAFFGVVFLRYGLLATSSAVLTVETVLLAFPMYTMLRNLYPVLLTIPGLVWLVAFMGAGAIYLQPQLATAYRRVTAVFE